MIKRLVVMAAVLGTVSTALIAIGCGEKDGGTTPPADPCANISVWTVISPDSAAVLKVGQSYTIQWCYAPSHPSKVGVDLSTDDGISFIELTTKSLDYPANTFTFTPSVASATCNIRIRDYDAVMQPIMSKVFTIQP